MTQSPLSHHKDSQVSACILEGMGHLESTLGTDSATLSLSVLGEPLSITICHCYH